MADVSNLTRAELDYQVARHARMHMLQWPHADRDAVRVDIRRRLLAGQAWMWPAPAQMDLFGRESAVAGSRREAA